MKILLRGSLKKVVGWVVLMNGITAVAFTSELYVGAATVDITPDQPAALAGQMYTRVSTKNETPIVVSALALESRDGDKALDQAIMVSCDLLAIRDGLTEMVRDAAKDKIAGFDLDKLVLSATHTHTAPVTWENSYDLKGTPAMAPQEYTNFLVERIVEAAKKSWESRKIGKVGWGQGQAVIAQNRRATYADGTAKMYGATNDSNFRGIEGYEDHNLDVLFFWNMEDKLIATAVNVPCPSQEVGSRSAVNADFWHPVRKQLRERHGKDLHVIAWTGASGDQMSRPMYSKAADERMLRLRGLTRLEEMARRLLRGWEEAYEAAKLEKFEGVVLKHQVEVIQLPWRKVTEVELAEAKAGMEQYKDSPKDRPRYLWNKRVIERYETEKAGKAGVFEMELHTLRLGDVAIATNPFELFTDFGVQMKARSPAVQTFVIELSGGYAGYLPSVRAVAGGGYSAVIQSSSVGPEGGQVLVERTVEGFNRMWEKK